MIGTGANLPPKERKKFAKTVKIETLLPKSISDRKAKQGLSYNMCVKYINLIADILNITSAKIITQSRRVQCQSTYTP